MAILVLTDTSKIKLTPMAMQSGIYYLEKIKKTYNKHL